MSRLYLISTISISGGAAIGSGSAEGESTANVTEFQEKQVVKRGMLYRHDNSRIIGDKRVFSAFIQTVAKYAPKAATLIINANSAIKKEEFKRNVIIGLAQVDSFQVIFYSPWHTDSYGNETIKNINENEIIRGYVRRCAY